MLGNDTHVRARTKQFHIIILHVARMYCLQLLVREKIRHAYVSFLCPRWQCQTFDGTQNPEGIETPLVVLVKHLMVHRIQKGLRRPWWFLWRCVQKLAYTWGTQGPQVRGGCAHAMQPSIWVVFKIMWGKHALMTGPGVARQRDLGAPQHEAFFETRDFISLTSKVPVGHHPRPRAQPSARLSEEICLSEWGASKQRMKLQQPRNYDFRVSRFDPPRSQSGNDRETTTSPPGHHWEANVALTTTAKLQPLRVNSREMTTFPESWNDREMQRPWNDKLEAAQLLQNLRKSLNRFMAVVVSSAFWKSLTEGSAGVSQRTLRGLSGVLQGLSEGSAGGGPRDFPRFFRGSDPMLVTFRNCWINSILIPW